VLATIKREQEALRLGASFGGISEAGPDDQVNKPEKPPTFETHHRWPLKTILSQSTVRPDHSHNFGLRLCITV
jgi:hypothetical protein